MDTNELRTLLMVLAKDAGQDDAVDRLAAMSDEEIAALAAQNAPADPD